MKRGMHIILLFRSVLDLGYLKDLKLGSCESAEVLQNSCSQWLDLDGLTQSSSRVQACSESARHCLARQENPDILQ